MFTHIQIETTTFCNAKCWFCPSSTIPKEHMDWELFKSVIDSTRGMRITYRPFGLGEPLVDPRISQILDYIKEDKTAKVELHTNGEPLTEKIENKIKDKVDLIRFSIDGITKETFDESRGISLEKTYKNTERFIRNNPDVEVEVRMINLPGTEKEQEDYINHWNRIRPGCVSTTKLYEHPWTTQTTSTNDPCNKCQSEAFVYINGDVHPCPWDFENRKILGNVKDKDIVQIWKQHKYKEFRDNLSKGKRSLHELCSRCNAVF